MRIYGKQQMIANLTNQDPPRRTQTFMSTASMYFGFSGIKNSPRFSDSDLLSGRASS